MKAGPGCWCGLNLLHPQGHWLVVCTHRPRDRVPLFRLAHDGWALADMLGQRSA